MGYVVAADGTAWTLGFLVDGAYATEQAADRPPTLHVLWIGKEYDELYDHGSR